MTDQERQKELVLDALDQFERPLTQYAIGLLQGDVDSARDAVQHAFMKLCERPIADLNGNQGPWLYTVCRNRVMDKWRRLKREPLVDEQQANGVLGRENDPAVALERMAMMSLVQKLIAKLAASEREVAQLYSQGFNHKEMAAITGRSEGAIRVSLHRAIKSLRANPKIQRWVSNDEPEAISHHDQVATTMGQRK